MDKDHSRVRPRAMTPSLSRLFPPPRGARHVTRRPRDSEKLAFKPGYSEENQLAIRRLFPNFFVPERTDLCIYFRSKIRF